MPQVQLLVITTPDCPECYDIESVVTSIKGKRLNITSETRLPWTDGLAASKMYEYNITRAPTIIMTGEVEAIYVEPLFPISEDAMAYYGTPPPFIEAKTGKVRGLVEMTVIKPESCTNCFNIDSSAEQIEGAVKLIKKTTLKHTSQAAKSLILIHNITKVPAILLNQEAELYPLINKSWEDLGTWETDGSLVLRSVPPPYIDPKTDDVKGLVSMIMLRDRYCPECYNASVHTAVLSDLGIAISKIDSFDIQSPLGHDLANKYNITGVPTVILSSEASMYPLFNQIWPQVGTSEKDGKFVFRAFETLGNIKWKDIPSGRVKGIPTYIVNLTSNRVSISDETSTAEEDNQD